MRKHSVAILKRIHAPFALTYVVIWRVSPQKTYGHLLCKRINLLYNIYHPCATESLRLSLSSVLCAKAIFL